MHITHGHSVHQQQQMERVGAPPPSVSANPQKPSGAGGGFAIEDVVDLSPHAKSFGATAGQTTGPGNPMHSAAARARAAIALHGNLAGMSFGQVVSGLNHGTLNLTPPVTDGEETGDPATVGATETVIVADVEDDAADPTSDPAVAADPASDPVVVADPVSDPVVAVDPASDPVVVADPASDPVVAVDPASDPVVVADPASDPVVAVDTMAEPVVVADTTSTLLDLIEGDEEPAESDQLV